MATETSTEQANQIGPGTCFNCGAPTSGDFYCHGCHAYVCDECEAEYSVASVMVGPHRAGDHLEECEEGPF
jgi:hypothetical protein